MSVSIETFQNACRINSGILHIRGLPIVCLETITDSLKAKARWCLKCPICSRAREKQKGLAYLFTKTENLIPCIVIHYLINIITLIISVSFVNDAFYIIYSIVFVGILPWIINILIVKYTFEYWDKEEKQPVKELISN